MKLVDPLQQSLLAQSWLLLCCRLQNHLQHADKLLQEGSYWGRVCKALLRIRTDILQNWKMITQRDDRARFTAKVLTRTGQLFNTILQLGHANSCFETAHRLLNRYGLDNLDRELQLSRCLVRNYVYCYDAKTLQPLFTRNRRTLLTLFDHVDACHVFVKANQLKVADAVLKVASGKSKLVTFQEKCQEAQRLSLIFSISAGTAKLCGEVIETFYKAFLAWQALGWPLECAALISDILLLAARFNVCNRGILKIRGVGPQELNAILYHRLWSKFFPTSMPGIFSHWLMLLSKEPTKALSFATVAMKELRAEQCHPDVAKLYLGVLCRYIAHLKLKTLQFESAEEFYAKCLPLLAESYYNPKIRERSQTLIVSVYKAARTERAVCQTFLQDGDLDKPNRARPTHRS